LRLFYRARFARIYPVVFASTALAIVVVAIFGEPLDHRVPVWLTIDPSLRVRAILSTLLLTQAWIPIRHLVLGVNPPAWSLSAEAFFYLYFPLIACCALRARLIIGCAATIVVALAMWAAFSSWGLAYRPPLFVLNYFPPIRLVDFTFGVLLGAAFVGSRMPNMRLATAIEVGAVTGVACALTLIPVVPESLRYAAWMMPGWATLVFVFAYQAGAVSAWLSSPALLHLGRISFAFYLVHWPITMAFAAHAPASVATPGALIVALMVSSIVFGRIEQPMRGWILGTRRSSTPLAVDAVPISGSGRRPQSVSATP
jgi:peptidoglycan/LPS O-acetylase OafA/YrhL